MRKINVLIIFILGILTLSSGVCMAPGSSTENGLKKDLFVDDGSVYFMHTGSFFCNSNIYKGDFTLYVVNDKNWSLGESISGAVYSANFSLNINGKLSKPIEWNSSVPGKYDVIFDVNMDGKYNENTACFDLIDGTSDTGFIVLGSETKTADSTANSTDSAVDNQSNSAVEGADVNESRESFSEGISSKFSWNEIDSTSIIIVLAGFVIAVIIVAITIVRLR